MTDACDLCGDVDGRLFLQARCHPSAPLRAVKDGAVLILRCYVPECDREVARFDLIVPNAEDDQGDLFSCEEHEGFLG